MIDSARRRFKLSAMLPRRCTTALARAALALTISAVPCVAAGDLGPARTSLEHGDYVAAESALRTARGADRAGADRLMGRLFMETGRYDDARLLGARLGRAPGSRVDGLTLEGEALAAAGQYDDAIARWTAAVGRGEPGVARRARAFAAVWQARLGRRAQAQDLAQPLVDEYNDAQQAAEDHPDAPGHLNPHSAMLRDAEALAYLGMAMRTLGFAQDANQAFNESTRLDPHRAETLEESAELYLSKEDMGHAGEALRDALATNPHDARALVLRARTRLMSDLDFAHASDDLAQALAVNARRADAYVLRAGIVLRDGDTAQADRLVDQALAINPRELDALAMRGVVRFEASDDAGLRRAFDALFAIAPTYVDAYDTVADFADWDHRYDDAIALMREALARPAIAGDPRLQGRVRAQLGINLLRTGDETHGLEELRESFRQDRYNVRVFNLLNLYEDTLAHHYVVENSGPFVIRYHDDERAVMSRYVPQLLTRAYDDMVARYHFRPQGPLHIEMYASSQDFSVRTSGLPEIGVQGVCFGRVVTAISPEGGPFNWGQILWHELAHVFAIQLSRSRVPRWFTEGLAEWEAFHSHPEWAREDDASLYRAMVAQRVPRVADFNTAFTHARSGGDMLVAYYAASKLVEFMIGQYGFDRVVALLPRWGRGLPTTQVIQQGLGVSADALDGAFRAATMQRLARFAGQFAVDESEFVPRAPIDQAAAQRPTDAEAVARAAVADLVDGDADGARQKAQAAIALDPHSALAHWVLARVAMHARDGAAALREIDGVLAGGRDGYALRVLEYQAARLAHEDARTQQALEAATREDATQSEPWEALAEIYDHQHRAADRLRALRLVVALDQHDRPALRTLLGLLVAQGAWADVRALAEHARNLDPETAGTHVALARAAQATGARADAIYEYESSLLCSPREPAPIHAALAALYTAAGNRAQAQAHARLAGAASVHPVDPVPSWPARDDAHAAP